MAKKKASARALKPQVREDKTGPLGDDDQPELSISTAKVCYFIAKAREFEAKDAVTDPDPGSNPSDDDMISVLEDHDDDPVQQELRELVAGMSEDEQVDLVALAWLGRDDATIEDWQGLRDEALRVHGTRAGARTASYLLGMPLVSEYLEEALSLFGRSCDDELDDV